MKIITLNEFVNNINFPSLKNKHIIGLDLGYSSPKCFYEHGYFTFPNQVHKCKGELFGDIPLDTLLYKNDNNEIYLCGKEALNAITSDETFSEETYSRNHYLQKDFKVIFELALGLACFNKDFCNTNGEDLFIQTGLPPAYKLSDSELLKSIMVGNHKFSVTRGNITRDFNITLTAEQIDVMSQPMGTFNSLLFNDNGTFSVNAKELMSENVLLLDAGFVTLDKFSIRSHELVNTNSDNNLGMKRIFEEMRSELSKDYSININIPELRRACENGILKINDRINMTTKDIDLTEYFNRANKKVMDLAFDEIKDYVFDSKILIVTGGTSALWVDYFKERLKNLPIKIMMGNENTTMSIVYANARGYYFNRYHKMCKNT